jgi:hypothetical protein
MVKNRQTQRQWELQRIYGLTLAQYQELVDQQGNRCAICNKLFEKAPHVDHDHKTKWVRGLLCTKCNMGIGLFDDNPDLMQKAIDYVILNTTPTEFHFEPIALERRKPNIGTYFKGKVPWNKGIPMSEEQKNSLRGRVRSFETLAKMSAAQVGRIDSEETREKKSISQKERQRREREEKVRI